MKIYHQQTCQEEKEEEEEERWQGEGEEGKKEEEEEEEEEKEEEDEIRGKESSDLSKQASLALTGEQPETAWCHQSTLCPMLATHSC
jgi:hypothetical protein